MNHHDDAKLRATAEKGAELTVRWVHILRGGMNFQRPGPLRVTVLKLIKRIFAPGVNRSARQEQFRMLSDNPKQVTIWNINRSGPLEIELALFIVAAILRQQEHPAK